MLTSARTADVLFFHCDQCATELSVPVALQGIEGPCPCCGVRVQAPELSQPVSGLSMAIPLPPMDRRQAPPEFSAPVPQGWRDEEMDEMMEAPEGRSSQLRRDEMMPRRLSGQDTRAFQAKNIIPTLSELGVNAANPSGIDRFSKSPRVVDASFFRVARAAMIVITGGMCAGLGLYLKDRKWSLDLPWRPDRMEEVAVQPKAKPVAAPVAKVDPANPFVEEDPSELENVTRSPALTPLPEPVSVTVGASAVAE
jgi:hypothetical protein